MMLAIAQHSDPTRYWSGGNYELNLSFEMLRDRQWSLIMQALWAHPAMRGPLAGRYAPGRDLPPRAEIHTPPPTAISIQHGQLMIDTDSKQPVGCDVQATRSLFECVSILVPMGMFDMPPSAPPPSDALYLPGLDALFYDIALHVYEAVPFQVAVIGYERSCLLASELRADPELRHNFLVGGNFLIAEDVLAEIEPDPALYQEVRPGLRHAAAHGAHGR